MQEGLNHMRRGGVGLVYRGKKIRLHKTPRRLVFICVHSILDILRGFFVSCFFFIMGNAGAVELVRKRVSALFREKGVCHGGYDGGGGIRVR